MFLTLARIRNKIGHSSGGGVVGGCSRQTAATSPP